MKHTKMVSKPTASFWICTIASYAVNGQSPRSTACTKISINRVCSGVSSEQRMLVCIYRQLFGIFCCFSSKKLCFYHFHFFHIFISWWGIKFAQHVRFGCLWCIFYVQFEYSRICVISVLIVMYEKPYGITRKIRLYALSLRCEEYP